MTDQQPQSTEAISLADQVAWADAHRDGRPTAVADPISALRDQCKSFIEGANMNTHTRSMALVKCDEMIFWIRAGAGRG